MAPPGSPEGRRGGRRRGARRRRGLAGAPLHQAHAATHQGRLHLRRQGEALDQQRGDLQAVLLRVLQQGQAQVATQPFGAAAQVEHRAAAAAEHITQAADDQGAQRILQGAQVEPAAGTAHLAHQPGGVVDAQAVAAEAAQAHRTELGVAQQQRLARTPLEVAEQAGGHEHHLGLERALEAAGQTEQVGEQRQVGGAQGVAAGPEGVGDAPLIEEHGPLALAHDQLGAVAQDAAAVGVAAALEAPGQGVAVGRGGARDGVAPLDDLHQFGAQPLPDLLHRSRRRFGWVGAG